MKKELSNKELRRILKSLHKPKLVEELKQGKTLGEIVESAFFNYNEFDTSMEILRLANCK